MDDHQPAPRQGKFNDRSDNQGERITMGTADRADVFVRRQALWSRLLDLFRHHRPDEAQLTQVSTLAEVAIDQVFSAHHLSEAQQEERHGQVKDFAECAALYGYVLGYWQARQEMDIRAASAATAGD